jgi:hypothetical protein
VAERPLTHDPPDDGSGGAARDVGRTSGGGSLGHKQPRDVARQTTIRNHPSGQRPDEPAQGELQRPDDPDA